MIERHFGPIPANASLPPPPDMSVEPLLGGEVRETVPDQVPLPRIYLAHRIPPFGTDAFDALDVAADILGTGRASRLYASLVREQRLAQDVSVFVFPIVGGASMFALWVTARPGVTTETLEAATLAEVERLADRRARPTPISSASTTCTRRTPPEPWNGSASAPIGSACTPASSTSRSASTPSRAAGPRSTPTASRRRCASRCAPDNRVTLTYVPAEAAS